MYSTGLGPKRKSKPPSQRKDITNGDLPRFKKSKIMKGSVGVVQFSGLSNDHGMGSNCAPVGLGGTHKEVFKQDLSTMPQAIQIRTEEWVEQLQPVLMNSSSESREASRLGLAQSLPQRQFSCANARDSSFGSIDRNCVEAVPVLYVSDPDKEDHVHPQQEGQKPSADVDNYSDQVT